MKERKLASSTAPSLKGVTRAVMEPWKRVIIFLEIMRQMLGSAGP
jgi:hypothetical protein